MTTQQILQGVHDWTNGKIVYDISVAHPDGQGKPTPYADLAAALGTNGDNIPQSLQKGGMSIKFVQSSDNKYVQYRLMTTSFSIIESDWQGIDDEPTAGSENLVESGGVAKYIFDNITEHCEPILPIKVREGFALNNLGVEVYNNNAELIVFPVKENQRLKIKVDKDNVGVMQFQSVPFEGDGASNPYIIGETFTNAVLGVITVPAGASFLYISQNIRQVPTYIVEVICDIEEGYDLRNYVQDAIIDSNGDISTNLGTVVSTKFRLDNVITSITFVSSVGYIIFYRADGTIRAFFPAQAPSRTIGVPSGAIYCIASFDSNSSDYGLKNSNNNEWIYQPSGNYQESYQDTIIKNAILSDAFEYSDIVYNGVNVSSSKIKFPDGNIGTLDNIQYTDDGSPLSIDYHYGESIYRYLISYDGNGNVISNTIVKL